MDAKICSDPEGCDRPHYGHGLCKKHWRRARYREQNPPKPKGQWGDWTINSKGYVLRRRTLDGKREHQWQHHFVMEGVIGRPLFPDEEVHHRNGFRDDNRPENLELWSTSQPKGQRIEDKLAWAYEMVRRYGKIEEEMHLERTL